MLNNGPIPRLSSSFPHHQQQTTTLPPTTLLQSFSPKISKVKDSNIKVRIQQRVTNIVHDEKEQLKIDLKQLKAELKRSKETIARLQKSEEQMRER